MKTITHTRGSLETADVVADSIEALDDALRGSNLEARLEIPVVSSDGGPATVEVILGRRRTVTTEPSPPRPVEATPNDGSDLFEFDWL